MFGHDNHDDKQDDNAQVLAPTSADDSATTAPAMPADELNLPAPVVGDPSVPTAIADNQASAASDDAAATQLAAQPETVADSSFTPELAEQAPSSSDISINSNGTMNDLNALKQEALRELSPLIGQLDQSPDEKYATAKMVYEVTNDHSMLTAVYEAAKNLPDDKAKAEAIYDVIKKINESGNNS